MNEIKEYTEKLFEDIKHIDDNDNEYWLARELQSVLEYTQWRRFENVINKAKLACNNSKISINDHFADAGKMVEIGSNTKRETSDYKLSRYACYLITQKGYVMDALHIEMIKLKNLNHIVKKKCWTYLYI